MATARPHAWKRQLHPCLWAVVMALVAATALVGRTGWAAADRRLDPGVAAKLEAAVTAGGALQLEEGQVSEHSARLKVCAGKDNCATVELGDSQGCAATVAGPWCVRYTQAVPSFAAALQSKLAGMPVKDVWLAPVAAKPPPPNQPRIKPVPPRKEPLTPWRWPVGLALIAVPVAVGVGLGRLARGRRKPRVAAWLWSLGLISVAVLWLSYHPILGAWDALLAMVLLMATATSTAVRVPLLRLGAAVLALAGIAATVEFAARRASPQPVRYAPLPDALLLDTDPVLAVDHALDPTTVCAELFDPATANQPPPIGKRIVLHLGDELARAPVNPMAQSAFAQLDLPPDATTVVRLMSPGSLDAAYVTATRDVPRLRPRLVVLWLNDANDFDEFGRLHTCCGLQPFLSQAGDATPTVRCRETAPWLPHPDWTAYLLASRLPYLSLLLAEHSAAVAQTTAVLDEIRLRALQPLDAPARRTAVIHTFRALHQLVGQHQGRLVAVALPRRDAETLARGPDSMAALARQAGIEVLDPGAKVANVQVLEGVMYTAKWPGDLQLSGEGHYVMAEWLRPLMAERLR